MLSLLTKREKEILEFIKAYSLKKKMSPTIDEIKKHFRLRSTSTVHEHISNIVNKGYIEKLPYKERGLRIVDNKLDGNGNVLLSINYSLGNDYIIKKCRSTKKISICKDLLKEKGNFFVVQISKNGVILNDQSLFKNDLLIFKEVKKYKQKGIYITQASANLLLVKHLGFDNKQNIVARLSLLIRRFK